MRDVYIPPQYRLEIRVPKNKYDCIIYEKPDLFPLELKSTKGTSISFELETDGKKTQKMIKRHQVDALKKVVDYEGIYPGFVFNFREVGKEKENKVFFLHILDFQYFEENYTQKSIPIKYCVDKGIEIKGVKLRTNYRYDIRKMVGDVLERFGVVDCEEEEAI